MQPHPHPVPRPCALGTRTHLTSAFLLGPAESERRAERRAGGAAPGRWGRGIPGCEWEVAGTEEADVPEAGALV